MLSFGKITSQTSLQGVRYPYVQIVKDSLEFVYSYNQQQQLKVSVLAKQACYNYTDMLLKAIDTLNKSVVNLNNDKALLLENEVNHQKIITNKNKVIDNQEQAILTLQSDANKYLINNVELNTKYLKQRESSTKWKGYFYGLLGTVSATVLTMVLK